MAQPRTSSAQGPDVIGLAEVATLLGVSRQRASEIVRRPGFPAARRLAAGPVWLGPAVRAWARTWTGAAGAPVATDGSSAPVTSEGPPLDELPELSRDDLETLAALSTVDNQGAALSQLYLEAHQLLAGRTPIDPLPLVAHDIRDILMKLHETAATPGDAYIDVSKSAYHELKDAWTAARQALVGLRGRPGAVDEATDRFLTAAERLLGVAGPLKPRKGKNLDAFLRRGDPARHLLPNAALEEQGDRWERERRFFNAVGHHSRNTDIDEVRQHIRSVNQLMLAAIRPQPFDVIAELDDRIAAAEASDSSDDVSAAIACISNGVEADYFFEHINGPVWLDQLRSGNWFSNPPEPIVTGTTTSFAAWVPGGYLERVASQRPEEVVDICASIATSTNPRVRHAALRALVQVPADKAARFTKQATRWAGDELSLVLVARDLADLALHLANGGQPRSALSIMRRLLALEPVPETIVDVDGLNVPLRHDPRPRYAPYEYRQIIAKVVPGIVDACGFDAFKMLSRTLAKAISARHPDSRPPRDLSSIWRPTIERSADNLDVDALDGLLDAVRDAGAALLRSNASLATQLFDELGSAAWDCHRRVLLHLARVHSDADARMAVELLMDRGLLHDYAMNHERDLLARDGYVHLSKAERLTYLEWIDLGPDQEALRDLHRRVPTRVDVATYVENSVRSWQRDRLAPIAGHLPAVQRRRLARLIQEHGEAEMERPRFRRMVGAQSPVTNEALAAMSVAEIADYLALWKPDDQYWGPSREGLANRLEQLVKGDPARYAAEAHRFAGAASIYRRALLAGWRDAASGGKVFPWAPVLTLAEDALTGATSPEGDEDPLSDVSQPGTWLRQEVGRLLEHGLRHPAAAIPIDERDRASRLVLRLLRDDDPTPADESRFVTGAMDAMQYGINTVRGQAVENAVHLIRWVTLQDDADGAAAATAEVLSDLARMVGPEGEASVAVRAIIGMSVPQLAAADGQWMIDHRLDIFPRDPSRARLREAAWRTYLVANSVYLDVFDLLREEYEDAVDRLARKSPEDADDEGGVAGLLGTHLIALYNHGTIALSEGSILDRFFRHAPVKARQHVLFLEGRLAYEMKSALDTDIATRIGDLWEHRISIAREQGGSMLHELRPYAWTFASAAFDPESSLEQLNRILSAGVRLEGEHLVAEQLVRLASAHETRVLDALRGLVRNSDDQWGVAGWIQQAGLILDVLDKSNDPVVVEGSRRVRNELGTRGFVRQLQPLQPRAM